MNQSKNKLGELIKHMRKARHLTQKDLATRVGTTSTTISNYEVGYSKPSIECLRIISRVLDVDISYFDVSYVEKNPLNSRYNLENKNLDMVRSKESCSDEAAAGYVIQTTYDTVTRKLEQKSYSNMLINFYYIDNVTGLKDFDCRFCDGTICLPFTNEFNNQNIFATIIRDESMAKRKLTMGTCIIVNRSQPLKNNSIVLAYIKPENRIVVRQYTLDCGAVILIDDSYSSKAEMLQYYEKDVQIIGTVVKAIIDISN